MMLVQRTHQRFRQRCAASGLRCFTGHMPCEYTGADVPDRLFEPLRSAVVKGRSIAWYFTALTGLASCDAV